MPPEHEPVPHFTIDEQQVDEIDEATIMRRDSWIDTYENPELDVTREWIEDHFSDSLSEEKREAREKRFVDAKARGTFNAWVAHDDDGRIIGATTPFLQPDGTQRLGSIYVNKLWLGKGVGAQLMQKAIDWLDSSKPIELGVVTYNERAKAFYRRWGFVEIPNSEDIYAGILPQVHMVRQPMQDKEIQA